MNLPVRKYALPLLTATAALACASANAKPLFDDKVMGGIDASTVMTLAVVGGIVTVVAVLLLGLIVYLLTGPRKVVTINGTRVELWVRERKMPRWSTAIVAPVAPCLRMTNGIAKWVRDSTGGKLQAEALKAAPLQPGEAFVGPTARYRFRHSAVAVVMDAQKRVTPDWIADGIASSLAQLNERGAKTCLLPDMTEDLLRQPQWVTDEERVEACATIARAMLDGVARQKSPIPIVRIWVWRTVTKEVWVREFERFAENPASTSEAVTAA